MSHGDAKLREFVHRMKAPFHNRQRLPTNDEVHIRQLDLLKEVWGLTPAVFDEQWRAWVLAKYRERPRKHLTIEDMFLPQ